ncbi:MAG TPA: GNAT family protein [Bacteroidia bacterium]|nr:GNAT family protein [Bacteroidia bacterium]
MILFDFSNDYILEDDVVLLRPLKKEDIALLSHYSVDEPELWWASPSIIAGEENFKKHLEEALKFKEEKKEYPFIVYDKRTKEYAGSTRFYDIQLLNQSLQLGYTWYGKKFQATGLNKHCKFLLLSFAFEQMNMERVEFRAHSKNERSIAAMKSIGCVEEGILRKMTPMQGGRGRRDTIVLSILKEEWESGVKENLRKKL